MRAFSPSLLFLFTTFLRSSIPRLNCLAVTPEASVLSIYNDLYRTTPTWEIGRPQQKIVDLVGEGTFQGSVLEVGSGTGENLLHIATHRPNQVMLGVDTAPLAISRARSKALERGLKVHFEVFNALNLDQLNKRFNNVVDVGLYQVLNSYERQILVEKLPFVLAPGGTYHMLSGLRLDMGTYGICQVDQQMVQDAFSVGWVVQELAPATFETVGDQQTTDGLYLRATVTG